MLKNDLQPNEKDEHGQFPIFSAIVPIAESGFSSIGMLKDLIAAGANVNIVTNDCCETTPIFTAIYKNALAHLVILLESGADPWRVVDGVDSFEYSRKLGNINAQSILREFSAV